MVKFFFFPKAFLSLLIAFVICLLGISSTVSAHTYMSTVKPKICTATPSSVTHLPGTGFDSVGVLIPGTGDFLISLGGSTQKNAQILYKEPTATGTWQDVPSESSGANQWTAPSWWVDLQFPQAGIAPNLHGTISTNPFAWKLVYKANHC